MHVTNPADPGDPSVAVPTRTVVVVAGGSPVDPATVADLPGDAVVVAADSGLDVAIGLGWPVGTVVGDLDSASSAAVERAEQAGTVVHRHPSAKDETDLELALDHAVALGATRIVVVALAGDRFDHVLGNALILAAPKLSGVEVEGRFGTAVVKVVRRRLDLRGTPGQILSLVPVHGAAHGVVTSGLRYPLRDETLEPGSPRGLSNELVADEAWVSVRVGTLIAVTPSPFETTVKAEPLSSTESPAVEAGEPQPGEP